MKVFLICPVRGHSISETEQVVRDLEYQGMTVHFPPRDTKQDGDPTGYRICSDNLAAIRAADAVYIIWDGLSQGGLFDAGMAFALGKKLVVLSVPAQTEGKSFQNMFTQWAITGPAHKRSATTTDADIGY